MALVAMTVLAISSPAKAMNLQSQVEAFHQLNTADYTQVMSQDPVSLAGHFEVGCKDSGIKNISQCVTAKNAKDLAEHGATMPVSRLIDSIYAPLSELRDIQQKNLLTADQTAEIANKIETAIKSQATGDTFKAQIYGPAEYIQGSIKYKNMAENGATAEELNQKLSELNSLKDKATSGIPKLQEKFAQLVEDAKEMVEDNGFDSASETQEFIKSTVLKSDSPSTQRAMSAAKPQL